MASEDIGSLVVRIEANMQNFVDSTNRAEGFLSGLKKAALGLGAVLAGGAIFKSFVDDAAEAEANVSQLDAVLKSTKGAAGVTKDSILELAGSLQKVTKFSDDQVIAGDNLLLTFTKIGKDVFPQATETMLNMSQALGQDVKSSAIQLGKALNDPINGVTALSRVGVSFTESQKEVIKKLVETGDTAGAQKIILAELNTEFGNSARAAGETFGGKLERLKNQLGEVKESIGGQLLPKLSEMAQRLIDHAPEIQDFIKNSIDKLSSAVKFLTDNANILIPALAGVTGAIVAQNIISGITKLYKAWQLATAAQTTVQWLLNAAMSANPIGLVAVAIGVLIAAGVALYKNWDVVKAKAQELWDKIKAVWESIKTKTSEVWNGIKTSLKDSWQSIIDWGSEKWQGFKDMFLGVFDGIGKGIKGYINVYISALNFFIRALNKIKFSIPDWVPELGGKSFGINIPQIPKLAKGTNFVPFDTMAFLHKGEAVIPANNNPSNSGAKNPVGQSLNFEGMFAGANFYVRDESDIKKVAKELFNLQTTRARAGGTVYG